MRNGRLAYPAWTRGTVCQNPIHNRTILGGSSAQWAAALHEQIAVRRAVTGAVIGAFGCLPISPS
jgi:hypothetical protein